LQSPVLADSLSPFRIPIHCGEAKDVLVLSRKVGERILIGDKITITVVKIGHGGVRVGVEAPPELAVVREELAQELERTERALVSGQAEHAE
jgi:carbon storage regulator